MEIFIPNRSLGETTTLMARLTDMGIRGRDAAYLASIVPPQEPDSPELANFVKEFEFMVDTSARASVAALIGLLDHGLPMPAGNVE